MNFSRTALHKVKVFEVIGVGEMICSIIVTIVFKKHIF